MKTDHYVNTLIRAQLEAELEEDLNQLEKQKQEMWWHQQDQDEQAIEDFCSD